ncbi:MAG TPA: polysaccharide biosynthesis C-terminal domain-containing protein [Saprospiraceae bacterium]|nr:polysaccharide biosynthesis C-terminal domain-containing protein [Saprospiraceae bacterium]
MKSIYLLLNDPVRQVQLFMLCRHTGVILSSIVIARSLPIEEVGVFEMLMLCGYLMTFFWSDALLKGFLSDAKVKADKIAVSAFIWLYLFAGLTAMIILVIGQKVLLPLFVDRSSLQGIHLFILYQALIIPVWIAPFLGLLKGQNAILLSIYVLVGPAFACWAGWSSLPELSGVLIGLLSYALVGFAWVLTNTTFVRKLQLGKMLATLWPVTWPLMMYSVSVGIARSFDVWLVARHFDEASFAIFRYGAREFPLVVAFAAGLSTVMIPKLYSSDALEELRTRSTRLMHICYPLVAFVMLFSPPLFEYFFGVAYKESALIYNIYLLLTITQLVFPQSIMTARGETRWLWYISLAELGVNVVASVVLLSYFGLAGIAMGTLIAFVFEKAVLIIFVQRRWGISLDAIIHPLSWLAYAALLTAAFMTSKWIFGI